MSKLLELLGQRIKELRNDRGMSQEELGTAAEISRDYVGQIERGKYAMTVAVLVRIAKALGTDGWAILQHAERKAQK